MPTRLYLVPPSRSATSKGSTSNSAPPMAPLPMPSPISASFSSKLDLLRAVRPGAAETVDMLIEDMLAKYEVDRVDQEWAATSTDIQAGWKGRN